MQNENPLELENLLIQKRRRKLIPVWIKIFIWIFIALGAFVPLAILISLSGREFSSALYGLETNNTFSNTGIIICALFFLKGITALALWTEKSWAIKLGIIDAVSGIIICSAVMIAPVFNNQLIYNYRLELILLIPYLIWLFKIRTAWETNYNH
ncbi:MAG: hypothetical protein ACHQF0_15130 [Chitinophagales bacterium]